MKRINYNLKVSNKDSFIIQMRILRPDLSLRNIEILYYFWAFPDSYAQELVKNKYYRNKQVVDTVSSHLTDMELLVLVKNEKKVKRILSPKLSNQIVNGNCEIYINLQTDQVHS